MSIVRDSYPRCCGFKVLREFPAEHGVSPVSPWLSSKERESLLAQHRQRIVQYFKNWRPAKMNFMVVVNDYQYEVAGDLLVENDFRLVDKTVNPNTDNVLYTFIRSNNLPLT